MRILGLDEAGRGAVLGPMVVGAYCVDAERVGHLVAIGVTDSKRLAPRRRVHLAAALRRLGDCATVIVPARRIDTGNLNRLEEEVFIELVRRFQPDRVVLDAPCHPAGIPQLVGRLAAATGLEGQAWTVEPKADLNHPPCGAASILAKVERDRRVRALGAVGSGYPSDPKTRAWIAARLREGPPLPDCIRTRWGTVRSLAARLGGE